MWTRFMDMHSGGGCKEKYEYIYIEAAEAEAKVIFYNRFGHNPDRVTCTCCGGDYSIDETDSIEQSTAYERGCDWAEGGYIERHNGQDYSPYQTIEEYKNSGVALFIHKEDIKDDERSGDLPEQGYVWMD